MVCKVLRATYISSCVSSHRPGLETMSKSRQDFVKGVVSKAKAEAEIERDAVVVLGAELSL